MLKSSLTFSPGVVSRRSCFLASCCRMRRLAYMLNSSLTFGVGVVSRLTAIAPSHRAVHGVAVAVDGSRAVTKLMFLCGSHRMTIPWWILTSVGPCLVRLFANLWWSITPRCRPSTHHHVLHGSGV